VKRQYVGCAGRVSNAINIVYCSFATRAGHALVGARPCLPREWATDPERRARAGVPEHAVFATKPELGRQILADLHCDGRLPGWVTGDEVYGRGHRHRRASTHQRRPRTPADQTRPGTTGRSGTDPPHRRRAERLVNLLTRTWHSIEYHLRWHTWRRRHQARARWFHYRAASTTHDKITFYDWRSSAGADERDEGERANAPGSGQATAVCRCGA
jgi:hypothetical protein